MPRLRREEAAVVDNRQMTKRLFLVLLCAFITLAARAQSPLTITTAFLDPCVIDEPCLRNLQASSGTAPLQWRIVRGSLPPGLHLDPATGAISGTAASGGEFEVEVEVRDSSSPQQSATRLLKSKSLPALTLEWKVPPTLQGTTISGSIAVSNYGADAMDLTVIIVAVNEVGKAFALGYQHPKLAGKSAIEEIQLGSQLPAGQYTVRADAIGEIPEKNRIYRAAREAGPFQVPAQ